MVALNTLGEAIDNISITAHNGCHGDEDTGGIPIVMMFGDDCQMPPPMAKGAFDMFIDRSNFTPTELSGREMFLKCAEDVMTLQKKKQTMADQAQHAESLDKARVSNLKEETSRMIVSQLSLYNYKWEDIKKLTSSSGVLFVSANKTPVAEYNIR